MVAFHSYRPNLSMKERIKELEEDIKELRHLKENEKEITEQLEREKEEIEKEKSLIVEKLVRVMSKELTERLNTISV